MTDRRLWLQTFESPLWTLFTFACVVTAVVIIVWLYRTERSLVPSRIGKWLLGLRLGVLGLVLAAMLQPVLSRTHLLEQRGRIVIAVDVSASMTTTDRQASPAEKLAWARALGMIGNASVNERLDRWAKTLAEGREPEWVLPTETSDPKQREELATVRKETLHGTLEAVDQLSRKEIARRLLLQSTDALLPAIAEQGNIEVRLFGGEIADADPEKLDGLIATPPESVGPDSTSLSAAVETKDTATTSGPIRAFVLLTDGRDTARGQAVTAARKLGELETPVYSVLLGSTEPVRDLAIAELDYPEVSFQDDSPRLSAVVRAGGFTGKSIEVVLQPKEGEAVRQTLTVEGEIVPVEMPLPTHGLGRHEYTLSVTSLPGESREDNNSREFGLNVVDDRIRVLLVEGEAGWEFRFIDNAL